MAPSVVMIVLNWNLPIETAACVTALLASDYPSQRVLVVDNGSTDDSVQQLRRRFGDKIDVVETGVNLFYAGGNNAGIQWAMETGADFILILNNDTVTAPDVVSLLVQAAQDRPEAGILAPMIYFGHNRAQIWSLGSRQHWWLPMPHDIGRGEIDRGQYAAPFEVDYVTGCAMMVRRTVFDRIGLFDPRYRMYYEDADLCARARRAGFKILVEPRAKVWHMVSMSSRQRATTMRYQQVRYRVRFYRQHAHGPSPGLTLLLLCLQELARMGAVLAQGRLDLVSAGWHGLRDGFQEKI